MDTAGRAKDLRQVQLERQLAQLETTLQSLRRKKNTDGGARDEYYRLKGVWARKKALLDFER